MTLVRKHRYISLDALKGFAMIMVILVHYNQSFSHNFRLFRFCQMGCQVFFVMSGLGVSFSLSKRFDGHDFKSELVPYYKSRIMRIAPAYYFMMAVVYLINTVLLHLYNRSLTFGTNRSAAGIICNVLFIHGLVPAANNSVMPGGWFIGTTMLLYLVAPFLYSVLHRFPKKREAICALISIASISVLLILTLLVPEKNRGSLVNNNSFGYFSILTQLPCFILGMLLFFQIQEDKLGNIAANIATGILFWACSIALFFKPFFEFSYIVSVLTVGLGTFFISKALIYMETATKIPKPLPVIFKIGQKSLYVYLVHAFFAWPFVTIVKRAFMQLGYQADNYFIYIVLFPTVVVLSFFSGLLLEKVISILLEHMFNGKRIHT